MKKRYLKIIKLTTREILLSFFDLTTPFLAASPLYRKSIQEYLAEREIDRAKFFIRLKYLRAQGYIQTFIKKKEKYFELTPKGFKRTKKLLLNEVVIKRPKNWDGKWRVIIFDIPEDLKHNRDIFRDKLKRLELIKIQKSVYVYPFECTQEISFLSEALLIKKYVTIMISEIIQGEKKIINKFLNWKVLSKKDLSGRK